MKHVFAFAALSICITLAHADDSRPLYVEFTEIDEKTYALQLRTPPTVDVFNTPTIVFPEDCTEVPLTALSSELRKRLTEAGGQKCFQCEESLAGRTVSVQYPGFTPSVSSLMKFIGRTGETHTVILRPEQADWTVPEAETRTGVARDYARLGMYHIWEGKDHLLFLVCLLWIAGSLRRILMTVTGFTLAHSVTLVLSALNVIRLPVPPVEAAIALSVVFLAVEIARDQRDTLTWRYPIAVSSLFGLVHGLGFAAVLSEIGLPQTELVTGLLFFNVGVEIGQVIFVVAVAALIFVLKRATVRWSSERLLEQRLQWVMSYTVGCIAAFWLVERTVGILDLSLF